MKRLILMLFLLLLLPHTIHAASIVPGRIFPMGDSTWRFIHPAMVANPPTGFTVKPADDTEYNVRWYGGSRLEHWNGYVSTEYAYWGDACAYPFKSSADGGGWLLFDLETPGESFTFYPCIQASDAEIFLVSVGWNNLNWNAFEGEWLNLDTLAEGFITFFEKLRTDFPGCTVIFLSEYPGCIDGCVDSSGNPNNFGEFSHDTECTPVCSAPNGSVMNARMASLIDKLKGLCAVENIPVLDAFTAVRNYYNDDTDQLVDTYFKDALHLRDQAGGTFYYETFVRPLLMEVLNPPTTTTTTLIVDTDQDGIVDSQDNCSAKPNGPNLGTCSASSDNPGINCTSDADCANGCSSNGICIKDQRDSDSDGTGDVCDNCPNDIHKTEPGICGCGTLDTDSDSDGIADCNDSCPNDPNNDADSDGRCANVDNCPTVCNPQQLDANGNGIGDLCDPNPGCGGGCTQPACEQACPPSTTTIP